MKKLEEVYKRLQESKKRRRDISKMYKDELSQSARYQEIVDEMAKLREEKKSIENEIKSSSRDYKELDDIKIDIQTDQELLSDIALSMYVEKEQIEIIDEYENKWYPMFKVTFKKE
ncbi:hypothetical protein CO057_00520 [Candidatus Uhrbacteria bacterium CG_4_9_14_0_2_um_filter_41_50]|uniref:Uncharacterized protein n=1 Tax=Candidatus Uhrbacteria bacterium CG_4_9_14_0_2_um_filter_41_50 TaxID=1975031 RepID=A0A2M8EQ87_9BACT|nr:MAG: hypothetical protein COZ45_02295 [Candidatus Uhrbacteria bacterium CG_4_10_14_3_um_filter_41_21]PIZ54497.1 MAG: hypothetical protein COY24_03655 [Candidatus Uhrbacteria bacterium CG_4_10_14_0_2_um_filter_41_21]PJB84847.1 MAG: hypothetical protein CO086_01500 [Candidatus Uhrbacteria bacterium CG_4_9_14_0_8_um_filter_41_16]PJC24892.1 MAG: hypothetical protein CO057_00520 [Candidatus Uhrbacteria bacterium CG_4_9_14_0_2_um_filter_41_50]PJE75231.1 MAG: hypothetical protein COV03_01160 [Candi